MTQQAPVQTLLACSQCGRTFAQSDLVHIAGNWVCGSCKPAYLSRVMATGPAEAASMRYAGVWIRWAARLIDGLVFMIPFGIAMALLIPNLLRAARSQPPNPAAFTGLFLTILPIFFLVMTAYEVLMLKYQGATVGKIACGLKVVRSDRSSLGWGVCFGRFFMWNIVTSGIPYVNFVFILISTIMAGTDEQKRALHDRVCDTRVIYKRSPV